MMSARVMPEGGVAAVLPVTDTLALSSPPAAWGESRVTAPQDLQPAAQRLEWELQLFKGLRLGDGHVSIWQPQASLTVTALEALLPRFENAAAGAARRGFPVHVRNSGGGCVCLGPGMLAISHLYCAADQGIERAYRDFAAKLLAAASRLRVALRLGPVTGAYGEGRYDLSCGGLKLGGIAQRRSTSGAAARVWVHAVLAVEERAADYPLQVQAFYRDLQSERSAGPDFTTVLQRCVPPQKAADLTHRLREDLIRLFCLPAPPARDAHFCSSKDRS
jgi:octanoyl-[GcvH]:protein N-octanoyltransferase